VCMEFPSKSHPGIGHGKDCNPKYKQSEPAPQVIVTGITAFRDLSRLNRDMLPRPGNRFKC
jgi:hypothetical protein